MLEISLECNKTYPINLPSFVIDTTLDEQSFLMSMLMSLSKLDDDDQSKEIEESYERNAINCDQGLFIMNEGEHHKAPPLSFALFADNLRIDFLSLEGMIQSHITSQNMTLCEVKNVLI